MNKKIIIILISVLSIWCVTSSCQDDTHIGIRTEATLSVEGVTDSTWTYISFVTGTVVGQSRLGNTQEDTQWYNRTDWDIALCSDMIRTNSGTSGKGKGGIQKINNRNFNAITTAPANGYEIDRNDIIMKR